MTGAAGPEHLPAELLAEHAEGLLDTAAAVRVDAHVGTCPRCAGQLAELRALPAALREAGPAMPDLVAGRLDRALSDAANARRAAGPTPGRRRGWSRRTAGLLAAAACVAAIVVGVSAVRSGPGTPTAGGTFTSAAPRSATPSAKSRPDAGPQAAPAPGGAAELADGAAATTLLRGLATSAAEPTQPRAASGAGCGLTSVDAAPGQVVDVRRVRLAGRALLAVGIRMPGGGGTGVLLPRCDAAAPVLARVTVR